MKQQNIIGKEKIKCSSRNMQLWFVITPKIVGAITTRATVTRFEMRRIRKFSFSFFIIVTVLFSSFMNAKLERILLFATISSQLNEHLKHYLQFSISAFYKGFSFHFFDLFMPSFQFVFVSQISLSDAFMSLFTFVNVILLAASRVLGSA